MIDIVALILLALLICIGGIVGQCIGGLWLAIGVRMVADSESRGLLADLCFMASWPIYWMIEG